MMMKVTNLLWAGTVEKSKQRSVDVGNNRAEGVGSGMVVRLVTYNPYYTVGSSIVKVVRKGGSRSSGRDRGSSEKQSKSVCTEL